MEYLMRFSDMQDNTFNIPRSTRIFPDVQNIVILAIFFF